MRRLWSLFLAAIPLVAACKERTPPTGPAITAPWKDDFERAELGGDWLATGPDAYKIVDGALNARGAHNHPLWLRRPIPRDAVIEVDAWATTPDGDLKMELWGDGHSFDPDKGAYRSSSYVFIQGGWHNSRSIIAREDEHAPGLPQRKTPKVEPGRRYHWKIVRKGGRIDWFVDDLTTPYLTYDDPSPLEGSDHRFLAFDNWESDAHFDNLTVSPAS